MNTIHTYTTQNELRPKISKRELLFRVKLLEDVLQGLIDHIAEKEKIQLGVMTEASTRGGFKYVLYQQELTKE